MMRPIRYESEEDEQVVVFDEEGDETDDDFEPANAPIVHHYQPTAAMSQQSQPTSPLDDFRPPSSKTQLESFLMDQDEPMLAAEAPSRRRGTPYKPNPLPPTSFSPPIIPTPQQQQPFNTAPRSAWERFDPLSPQRQSLLDAQENNAPTTQSVPGVAGYLEIEEEPTPSSYQESIQTSSGLLLTHRKPSASTSTYAPVYNNHVRSQPMRPSRGGPNDLPLLGLLKTSRFLVAVTAVLLMAGTVVLVHHSMSSSREDGDNGTGQVVSQQQHYEPTSAIDTIVLLPLPPQTRRRRLHITPPSEPLIQQQPLLFITLRREFDNWLQRHHKQYENEAEHSQRFTIWSANQAETAAKNARHGACQMTGKPVFGANHLADLTTHEFRQRYLQQPARQPMQYGEEATLPDLLEPQPIFRDRYHRRLNNCKWYDISCHLRYIFSTYLYGLGGTMEPRYDADSYPTALDWREYGAVTEVHSQGSCGACWAITATETAESAVFLGGGTLYDLAETEVIMCEGDSQMCAGGWPQNAFEYMMDHGGLPLSSDLSYDADMLLMVSEAVAGTSDEMDEDTVKSYQQATCPGGGGGGSGDEVQGTNTYTRYGNIKGYGYSTSKCVCYTDGSGCDCDQQNEGLAVRNLATYGPAVVCLDASTWQDYTDGIITSGSGCSQGFMDVNHCVQAVGYAYFEEGEENGGSGSGSGSNDHRRLSGSGSGSADNSNRNGYWIIRNQWSTYWGMSGYAYVAMGENTCGILNDMLQAYS